MKLQIVSSFSENGSGHYVGHLDVDALKKMKIKEVRVVLMPAAELPDPLASVARDSRDLLMFAVAQDRTPLAK